MAELQDTDKFLVNRSGNSYQLTTENLMAELLDDDLMLVNRAGVSYKATGLEIKESIDTGPTGSIETPVAVLTPLNGAGTNAGQPYQPLSTAITAVNAGGSAVFSTDTIASVDGTIRVLSTNTMSGGTNGLPPSDEFFGVDDVAGTSSYLRHNGGEFTWAPENSVTTSDTCTVRIKYLNSSDSAQVQYKQNGAWTTFVPDVNAVTSNPTSTYHDVSFTPATNAPWDGVRLNGGSNTHVTSILGIWINGDKVVNNGITLTFPTDNNFDKFEVGDVVQGLPGATATGIGGNNVTNESNIYDDDSSTYATFQNVGSYVLFSKGDGDVIPVVWGNDSSSTPQTISFTSDAAGNNPVGTFADGSATSTLSPSSNTTDQYTFTETHSSYYLIQTAGSENNVWVYTLGGSAVSITAIDPAGPTITTDGGSWTTSDTITKTVSSDASLTFTDDTELANMVGPLSQVDENGDVKVPVTSTIASVGAATATFKPVLYTGNGTSQSINCGFSPDLVWTKIRNIDNSHFIYDTIRGTDYFLNSNTNISQGSNSNSITSFDTDGFTVGSNANVNGSGYDLIAWCFDAGNTTVTNNDGTIATQVRSNGNFSVVKWDGDGSPGTVGTGLSSVDFILLKSLSGGDWAAWSSSFSAPTDYLGLNLSNPISSQPDVISGAPTGGVVPLGIYGNYGTGSVMYAWAQTPGVSSFGQYSGADSPTTLDFGFRPVFFMCKSTNGSPTDWVMKTDSLGGDNSLRANDAGAESTSNDLTFTDTGVVLGYSYPSMNKAGNTYIYAAFADTSSNTELTFETPNEDLKYFQPGDQIGTESGFAPVLYTGNGGTQSIDCGFSPSLVWIKARTYAEKHVLCDVIRGPGERIFPNSTGAESYMATSLTSFDANGFSLGGHASVSTNNANYVAWCFDAGNTTVTNNDGSIESQVRSNGNFSVITFTNGDGLVGHGLSSAPKFIITKSINQIYTWSCYHGSLGKDKYIALNDAGIAYDVPGMWGSSEPTDSVFGTSTNVAPSDATVAYAWAQTPGVSSFGEYTGNGSTTGPVIDCGFEPAFVMIKSSSLSSSSWCIWDTAREPNNPNGNNLFPNNANAESTDPLHYIDILDNGFQLKTANIDRNGSNETYIYAAFAGSNPIEVVDVDVAANKMTVDGGDWHGTNDWNQDNTWSNQLSAPGGVNGATNAFNGEIGSDAGCVNTGETLTFDVTGEGLTGSVKVLFNTGNAGDYTVTATGSAKTESSTQSLGAVTAAVETPTWDVGTLQTITLSNTAGSANGLAAVYVAGALLVNPSVTPTGETVVTGPPRIASADDVEYLDGNTLGVNGVSGTWFPGLHAQGAEVTRTAPSPESIQYTSANGTPLTTPFTGTDATLTTRTWTWQVSNAATGPWSNFATKVDVPGQDGAVPLADRPTLEENKFYQVKVRYDSNNAEFVESTFNTFKTGTNS